LVEVHVRFLPEEAGSLRGRAVVVIDVIRATTSLLAMLEGGCDEVLIAPTLDAARDYHRVHPEVLLAGEDHGRAPAGFDFGNSPAAFSEARLAGRRVVFATTNGTRAVHAVRDAAPVFLGCLRNRSATAEVAAAAAARTARGLVVVCAGREGLFSLDDAYTAGAIVEAVADLRGDLRLTDAAVAARMLFRRVEDPATLFRQTAAGQNVIEIGLAGDLDYCAQADRSTFVPKLGERVRVLGE
jgi:2-phosphosulfolactate phosphatase